MPMLEDFKCDLGLFDGSKDKQLQRLLEKSTRTVMKFTHQERVYCEEHCSEEIIELATIRYNRKGSEGLTSQSYSGVSEHYDTDIPLPIQRALISHRRLAK